MWPVVTPARAGGKGRGNLSRGPVTDLERYLEPGWWKRLFNATYLLTDGDVVEDDENTRRDVDLICRVGALDPEHRILDICCGQGRHTLELARRGFSHLTGVDQSSYLLRVARDRAKRASASVRFTRADARAPRLRSGSFDRVLLLGNSLGYSEDPADDLAIVRGAHAALAPGGQIILDMTDGAWMRAHFAPRSWEWIDSRHFVCRERMLSADGRRLICREVVVNVRRGVTVDQFYAETLYDEDALTALLQSGGFRDVSAGVAVQSSSERGQDLGMMEHRVILTARAGDVADQ